MGAFTKGAYNSAKLWKTDIGSITVGASLYLLVREADVSPKSFICPSSDQQEFEGVSGVILDIVEFWDFGNYNVDDSIGPMNCVSYSYHQPYDVGGTDTGKKGRFAADGGRSAAFAMMADRNPYFSDKLENGGVTQANWLERVTGLTWDETTAEKWQIQVANAYPHGRESQNVLFGDGHTSSEKRTDVGVKNDGIYTPWNGTTGTNEGEWRTGVSGKALNDQLAFLPLSSNDSVLVNDDDNGTLE